MVAAGAVPPPCFPPAESSALGRPFVPARRRAQCRTRSWSASATYRWSPFRSAMSETTTPAWSTPRSPKRAAPGCEVAPATRGNLGHPTHEPCGLGETPLRDAHTPRFERRPVASTVGWPHGPQPRTQRRASSRARLQRHQVSPPRRRPRLRTGTDRGPTGGRSPVPVTRARQIVRVFADPRRRSRESRVRVPCSMPGTTTLHAPRHAPHRSS